MCLPGFSGLTITSLKLSPTTEQSGGIEIGLSSLYSPPAIIRDSLSGVPAAICAPLLIVLTGFAADLPSLASSPICCEIYTRPPTSLVARR